MALYPLKRLARVGRVIVAAPEDPRRPPAPGFEVAASVEEAIRQAETPTVATARSRSEAVHDRETPCEGATP